MTTEHLVTSRRYRRCEGYRCTRQIDPGEDYVRAVAFPCDDVNGGTVPWVLRLCVACATEHGRSLPARRTITPTPKETP